MKIIWFFVLSFSGAALPPDASIIDELRNKKYLCELPIVTLDEIASVREDMLSYDLVDSVLSDKSMVYCWESAIIYLSFISGEKTVKRIIQFIESQYSGAISFKDFMVVGEGLSALGLYIRAHPIDQDKASSLALNYLVHGIDENFWLKNNNLNWSVPTIKDKTLLYFLVRRSLHGLGLSADKVAANNVQAYGKVQENSDNFDVVRQSLSLLEKSGINPSKNAP
ncbi:hypothetical protein KKB55_15865 [Myxococcota bacterium]|nr:hypothetical protein [Myxococcota bacterium]